MPKLFTLFSSFSLASLALPGMSGFVAESLVFFIIITSKKYLTKNINYFYNGNWNDINSYLLSMLRQMFYGYKLFNFPNPYFLDSGPWELFISICIFLTLIAIGIYPDLVLSLSVDKVQAILSDYFYR